MKKIIALLACMVALGFGLVACGANANPEDFIPNFAGTWELASIEGEENALSAEEIAEFKELGLVSTLTLDENGSASFDLFGSPVAGTWEAKTADTATANLEGADYNVVLAEDQLTLDQGGESKIVFTKAQANAAVAAAGEAASGADAADSEAAEGEATDDAGTAEDAAEGEDAAGGQASAEEADAA